MLEICINDEVEVIAATQLLNQINIYIRFDWLYAVALAVGQEAFTCNEILFYRR